MRVGHSWTFVARCLGAIAAAGAVDLALAQSPKTKAPESELDGYWHLVKATDAKGQPIRPGGTAPIRAEEAIFIAGNQFAYVNKNGLAGHGGPLTVKIDSTKSPKTMDFKVGDKTFLGIYKVENGEMTFATSQSTEKRPDTFSTAAASPDRPGQVHVYKRVPESAEDAAAKALPRLDLKAQVLDGLWMLEDAEENVPRGEGYPYNWEEAIYFENETFSFAKKHGWEGANSPFPIKFDPNAVPPTLDVKADKGLLQAIYKIEGDQLTIASNGPNGDRPGVFSTKLTAGPDRANVLRRYRRVYPTDEILRMKETGRLDPAKQNLDGLWIVDKDRRNVHVGEKAARLGIHEAVYFEKNKWLSAKKNGTLLQNEEKYEFKKDTTRPIPTLEMKVYANETLRGIYKIEGDKLYFATNLGTELPKYFTTNLTAGSGRARCTVTFTRAGKETSTVPVAAAETNPMPKARKDTSEVNGLWILEKVDNNTPPGMRGWDQTREEAIFIENDRYHYANKEGAIAYTTPIAVKTDATKTPKTFDYKMGQVVWRGIYKIENDVLTVATNFAADLRPDSFSTGLGGAGRAYHVRTYRLVRETPENALRKAIPKLDPETQKLDGLWRFHEQDVNALRTAERFDLPTETLYVEGDVAATLRRNNTINDRAMVLKANPKSVPPSLDISYRGKTWRCIYKIENDVLTIATCGTDDERPLWFTNKLTAGIGRAYVLRTYKRVSPDADAVKLKQPAKLDPAKQKLEGLWIMEQQSTMRLSPGQLNIGQGAFVEKGKWQSAGKDGKLSKEFVANFVSNPKAAVPTIDLKFKDEVIRGIYKVEGDTLYFAANFTDDRPRYFTTDLAIGAGRAEYVATFKRAAKR